MFKVRSLSDDPTLYAQKQVRAGSVGNVVCAERQRTPFSMNSRVSRSKSFGLFILQDFMRNRSVDNSPIAAQQGSKDVKAWATGLGHEGAVVGSDITNDVGDSPRNDGSVPEAKEGWEAADADASFSDISRVASFSDLNDIYFPSVSISDVLQDIPLPQLLVIPTGWRIWKKKYSEVREMLNPINTSLHRECCARA